MLGETKFATDTEVPKKSKLNKAGLVIAVLLIVIIGLIFWIIGFMQGKGETGDLSSKTTTLTATQTTTASLSKTATKSNAMADWKTYKSKQYSYQVKYPSSWVAYDDFLGNNTADSGVVYFYTASNMAELKRLESEQAETEGPLPEATVIYYKDFTTSEDNDPPRHSSLKERVYDTTIYRDTLKTTFAGQQAYQTIEGGMVDFFEYVLEKDGHIYKIMIPNKTSKAQLDSTEQNFLSSFEFTP